MTLKASTGTSPEVMTEGPADCIPIGQHSIADVLFEQLDYLIQFADQGT